VRIFRQMLAQMDVAPGELNRARFDLAILRLTNLAVGEKVEQFLALLGWRMVREDVAAKAAHEAKPIAQRKVERGFDFPAKALSDGGALARGGNCDLEIASTDDSGKEKIAVRLVVDGIDEDPAGLRREKNIAIHGGAAGGGDGEKNVAEIVCAEFAAMPGDIPCGCKFRCFGFGLRCDDGDVRPGAKQGSDF